jgi:Arc-like DNA binding domain
MARAPRELVNLKLRLPEALRQKLAAEAEQAGRSLNSEILWRLGYTFGPPWQKFIAAMDEFEKRRQEEFERQMNDPQVQQTFSKILAQHFAEHPEDEKKWAGKPRRKKGEGNA